MKRLVHIILTGGTLDSIWDPTKDTVVPNTQSALPEYFKTLKLKEETQFTTVCMKDSRNITEEDREEVRDVIEKSETDKIIVIHGTYTMPDTARYLDKHLKRRDQIVILTGAMIPLKGFSPSDAGFNVGFAFAKLHDLKPGVYLCMNGNVFSPNDVAKNIEEGKFYSHSENI